MVVALLVVVCGGLVEGAALGLLQVVLLGTGTGVLAGVVLGLTAREVVCPDR